MLLPKKTRIDHERKKNEFQEKELRRRKLTANNTNIMKENEGTVFEPDTGVK